MADGNNHNDDHATQPAAFVNMPRTKTFFCLPQEVRDIIYDYLRPYRWITITEMPDSMEQPSVSKVCKRVRRESLDVYYTKNRFMLDMRSNKFWKSRKFPSSWTPLDIFSKWITAIGDHNAARLRNLSFYLSNFAVHMSIVPEASPKLTAKLRPTRTNSQGRYAVDVADGAPSTHTFTQAVERAQKRLEYVIKHANVATEDRSMGSQDFLLLLAAIEEMRPSLCTRNGLGFHGAILGEDPSVCPDMQMHRAECADCGYKK